MVLKDLLAISGSPGLYKFIAQGKNAVIVEHLETGKRTSAHGSAKVSSLEEIAVFTNTDEVSLSEIFDKIYKKEDGSASISHKSSADDLKNYFSELLPEYDRNRVYVSDIKKIIHWYNLLHSLGMLEQEKEDTTRPDSKDSPPSDGEDSPPADGEDLKSEPHADSEDSPPSDGEDLKSEPDSKP